VPKPGSWWAARDLEREASLLPVLEAWGLLVPREARVLRDASGTVVGALQSVVEGRSAHALPEGRTERSQFARQVGAFLARLHALPLEGPGSLEASRVARERPGWAPDGDASGDMWEGHYRPLLEQAAARLPEASARWLEARGRRFADKGGVASAPRVLIHGDCSNDHLMIAEDGTLTGVIDWADAMEGDPALDFAALFSDYPPRFGREVLRAYEEAGGTVDADAMRRVAFYLDVAPVFGVLFAEDGGFPGIARADRRRLAARAAANTRWLRSLEGVI